MCEKKTKTKLTDVEINKEQSEKTLAAQCCQVASNLLQRQTERMHNDTPTMHNIEN